MSVTRTYDLFITHAWRYHEDWNRLTEMIDRYDPRCWRNFSLPWYDPALQPSSESGGKILRDNLETQIIPSHAVILLSSVFEQPASRKWLDYEIEMAHKHRKHIIAVPSWGQSVVPPKVQVFADYVGTWDVKSLLKLVDRCLEKSAAQM